MKMQDFIRPYRAANGELSYDVVNGVNIKSIVYILKYAGGILKYEKDFESKRFFIDGHWLPLVTFRLDAADRLIIDAKRPDGSIESVQIDELSQGTIYNVTSMFLKDFNDNLCLTTCQIIIDLPMTEVNEKELSDIYPLVCGFCEDEENSRTIFRVKMIKECAREFIDELNTSRELNGWTKGMYEDVWRLDEEDEYDGINWTKKMESYLYKIKKILNFTGDMGSYLDMLKNIHNFAGDNE